MNTPAISLKPCALLALLAATALLGGCVTQPRALYHWSGYQEQVYAHFNDEGSDPAQQIAALEASLQEARSRAQTPAPGFHAHLGMLYAQVGKADQVRQQFETEKALFPESATYMDFLLRNAAK